MLNHAIHMAAICQIRQTDSEGRRCYLRRVAEEKTKREAIRCLKRQVSNAVYRQLVPPDKGPGRTQGTTRCLRDRLSTLNGRLFGEVAPRPSSHPTPEAQPTGVVSSRSQTGK
jgi:transposase